MTLTAQTAHEPTAITIHSPATGELVGDVEIASADEAAQALGAAYAAQHAWEATPADERGDRLRAAAQALEEAADDLASLHASETGRPADDCRAGIAAGVGTLRQYAELGPVHRGLSMRGDRHAVDCTRSLARGVVVVLTPWNDPVAIACGLLGAAIVTGNTVVHKPSERCPHVGVRLGEIFASALPADVLTTVSGGGEVGRILTADARAAMIAHVGSTEAGDDIRSTVASHGAHVICENGGNDPLVVDRDVDPIWAAHQAATGSFANAGQICTSVERIFVHRDIADDFVDALCRAAKRWNADPQRQPLVDRPHRAAVHRHVQAALAAGARVHVGGAIPDGPGAHYPATVLTGCAPGSPVMDEETFGPLAPVHVVDDFDTGLELAAQSRFGLAATVLTRDLDRALRSVDRLRVGTVKINDVFGGAPGGSAHPRGDSGTGFGFGPELLDEMTTTTVVHLQAPQES